jgi:ectoine hydroxylase-related dioxygenase (phytanoyl-CoA dioxygenase family)
MPLVYVEMNPGDVLFFHCNLLHCSAPNRSDEPRWSLICVYNAARNDPYCESRHTRYTPLARVADETIKEVARQRFAASQELP